MPMGARATDQAHRMATQDQTLHSSSAPGWGIYQPAEAVHSLDQLKPGDVVLQRALKPGFPQPCLHVLEVIGGDPSGENRPLVRARLLDPAGRSRDAAMPSAWVVLWDFCLTECRTQLFRASPS